MTEPRLYDSELVCSVPFGKLGLFLYQWNNLTFQINK